MAKRKTRSGPRQRIGMNRVGEYEIVAVTEGKHLTDLFVDPVHPTGGGVAGNIYEGVVSAVVPHLQAAFIDIGVLKHGFLSIDDLIYRSLEHEARKGDKRNIQTWLRQGDQLIVQVEKEALGDKGPALTTKISLPGRYVVFMPYGNKINISRQISSEKERKRLHEIAKETFSQDGGWIIRTAAGGRTKGELKDDSDYVRRLWNRIERESERTEGIRLLHRELGVVERALRDHFRREMEMIVVGSEEYRNRVRQFLRIIAPRTKTDKLIRQVDPSKVWQELGVVDRLNEIFSNRVQLELGGSLIIEEMETLTAIDVNTGKFSGGKDLEDSIYRTNLEAASEIPRQLRLRQIGGIIVVDFIDMRLKRHRDQVFRTLEREMSQDRTPSDTLQFTEIGLVQMTRQRTGRSLHRRLSRQCTHCKGSGTIPVLEFS